MQPDAVDLARLWMAHAENDLLAAAKLLFTPPVLSGPAAFHAQQAAEKALKAFLVASGATFKKTHELEALLSACIALDAGFSTFMTHARELTPMIAEVRYPEGLINPDSSMIGDALNQARELVQFVSSRLPAEHRDDSGDG